MSSQHQNDDAAIERRLRLIDFRSSRRYFVLLLFVLFFSGAMGLMFYRQFDVMGRKIDEIQRSAPARASVPATAGPAAEQIEALKSRLGALELLSEAMESSSKSALEQMNFVFGIAAALVGVFGLYSLYRQTVAEASRDKHEEEMRGLVGSFRDNMSAVNSLIGTLEASFKHRALVDEQISSIGKQLTDISTFKSNIEQTLAEKVAGLNSVAFVIFKELDRENFKAEENRGRLQDFYITMNALQQRLENAKSFFSPISYFVRALHFFNVTQYKSASDDLETARLVSPREIAAPTVAWYRNSVPTDIVMTLTKMEKDCCYHLGIIYYNVGEYGKARERFAEAYQLDAADLRSRAYIPELMFFEAREPFKRIIAEFELVEREFDRWQTREGREKVNLETNTAALLMRKGNCYLPKAIFLQKRATYRTEENATEAFRIYEAAYEQARKTVSSSGNAPLTEVFVRLSLAQASKSAGRADWNSQPIPDLFKTVFFDIRKQVAIKTEPIVLTLFNYVLAICAHEGQVPNESASFYLSRSREQLQRVPSDVRIFSPINKINLNREEFVAEMETFENELD